MRIVGLPLIVRWCCVGSAVTADEGRSLPLTPSALSPKGLGDDLKAGPRVKPDARLFFGGSARCRVNLQPYLRSIYGVCAPRQRLRRPQVGDSQRPPGRRPPGTTVCRRRRHGEAFSAMNRRSKKFGDKVHVSNACAPLQSRLRTSPAGSARASALDCPAHACMRSMSLSLTAASRIACVNPRWTG